MKKDKFKVTVNGWVKLLATIIFFIFTATTIIAASVEAAIAMLSYILIFVYLAVRGSNNKIASWLSEKNFFIYICIAPTIFLAFYSFAFLSENKIYGTFAALLCIMAIPFTFILLFFQGGIRRWNGLISYVALPIVLYVLVKMFPGKMFRVAAFASLTIVIICFICAVIQSIKDHKADDNSGDDKTSSGGYIARWDGKPDSNVSNKIIQLKGTVIVEYTGTFYQSNADAAVSELIKLYVRRVGKTMKGYTVDSASLNIEYHQVG